MKILMARGASDAIGSTIKKAQQFMPGLISGVEDRTRTGDLLNHNQAF